MSDETRDKVMESFREAALRYLNAHPQYKSMMLGVAQYWADEADDAVHYDICVSEREQPLWPHRCDQTAWDDDDVENIPGEGCWNCAEGVGYLGSWDSNGDAIRAFEAYCHEAGSQDESSASNYLPYAVARKVGGGVEIEVIGRLQRPSHETADAGGDPDPTWDDPRARELFDLICASPADDGPRRVLADYLMENENPRGDYIALALDGKPEAAALLADHADTWMSPLARVLPKASARWSRGFLVGGEVLASDADDVRGALAWGTIESLFVHRTSECVLDPQMRALREIGVVPSEWIDALAGQARPWAIESLAIELDDAASATALAKATSLPKLRTLAVHADNLDSVVAALPKASWWKSLTKLVLVGDASLAAWQKRQHELGVPWIAVTSKFVDPTDALGWELALGPQGACEIALRGFTPNGSLDKLGEILPTIPAVSSIKLVKSAYYVPSAVDIERLGKRTTHPITI